MRTLPWRASAEVALLLFLLALFVVALVETRGLSSDGRLFPQVVILTGLPVIVAALVQTLWRARQGVWEPATSRELPFAEDVEAEMAAGREAEPAQPVVEVPKLSALALNVRFWLWFAAFCGSMWAFGFYVGLPAVSGLYVLVEGRKSWVKALIAGVLVWVLLYGVFTRGFGIIWPSGVFI
jgi:hypothetical protein